MGLYGGTAMGATICITRPRMEQLSRFRTATIRRLFTAPRRNAATALILAAMAVPALTERALAGPGDNEIRIGNTMPYTGPASAYGVIGKVMAAYFDKVNAEGGIRGRKINFISYDDAYNPTKTMEATRKLVEEDNVLFILASLGTNTSQAVHPYLNSKKIPQLFVASGADIFMQFTTPKFATMAIKRNAEIGWKPVHFLASVSESVSAVMAPAGMENAEGIISAMYRVEGEDAQTAGPAAFREWSAFMERYVPSVSKANGQAVYGYLNSKLIIEVLKNCGDDFSREHIMKQARSIKGLQLPMMVPGIQINTSPSDHATIEQMRMMRFTNGHWQFCGPVRSGIDPGTVSDSFKTLFKYGTATKRDLANQLNANTVSLMTGSFGSTYAQVGAEIGRASC